MVWLPVKNRRFWSPQKRLEISRGESNCGRSPGSLPLECRTFSGTGVFTVWYRDFYLKWKQTTFTLWRFQVLFIVSAAKTTGSISIFPQSIEKSHDNKTVLPFYICSYSPPVLWPHTAATSFPPAHDSALAGGDPKAFPHQMRYLDPAACFLIFPVFCLLPVGPNNRHREAPWADVSTSSTLSSQQKKILISALFIYFIDLRPRRLFKTKL